MSKCTPKSQEFINDVIRTVKNRFGYSLYDVKVYYDADKWNKRDYVLKATIRCYGDNWNCDDTRYLKDVIRETGATNIIGCVRHAITRDYLDLAFDIKKSKMKELGIDIYTKV